MPYGTQHLQKQQQQPQQLHTWMTKLDRNVTDNWQTAVSHMFSLYLRAVVFEEIIVISSFLVGWLPESHAFRDCKLQSTVSMVLRSCSCTSFRWWWATTRFHLISNENNHSTVKFHKGETGFDAVHRLSFPITKAVQQDFAQFPLLSLMDDFFFIWRSDHQLQ